MAVLSGIESTNQAVLPAVNPSAYHSADQRFSAVKWLKKIFMQFLVWGRNYFSTHPDITNEFELRKFIAKERGCQCFGIHYCPTCDHFVQDINRFS